ncbi:MAG: hypothetical protein EOP37_28200 [Rubrivivax sp.]|nr:MAG: hypothetical protein EOP37_28200 [Rubrivivax sp.]
MLVAAALVTLGLTACTFPKNTHLIRRAETLSVDGQRQAPSSGPLGELESRFAVDGAAMTIEVNGRRLVSSEVRLLYVVPVKERVDGRPEGMPLTVAVQLTSTRPWHHRLAVDGRLRDASGTIHGPAVIGMRDGLCGAAPKAEVRPVPDKVVHVPSTGSACLLLRYDLSLSIEARATLALGELTVEEPGVPARQHELEVEMAPVLTERLNGH